MKHKRVALIATALVAVGLPVALSAGLGSVSATNDPHPSCAGLAFNDQPAGGKTYTVPTPPSGWYYESVTLKGPNVNSGAIPSDHVTFPGPFYGGEIIASPFFKNGDQGQPMDISHADLCKARTTTTTTTTTEATTTTTTEVTTTTVPPTEPPTTEATTTTVAETTTTAAATTVPVTEPPTTDPRVPTTTPNEPTTTVVSPTAPTTTSPPIDPPTTTIPPPFEGELPSTL